jgi:SAM-dependent methyltransferase
MQKTLLIPPDHIKQYQNMLIAGRQAIGQFRQLLDKLELHTQRRERLFARFGSPRAAVVRGLTNAVLDFILTEGKSLEMAHILDYGCGIMPYRSAFELAGAQTIGADIGDNKEAQIKISDRGRIAIADNSFDYVLSFQVLEHVLNPNDYLTEAIRVLKPGGKLFLTTHGLWPYHPTPTDYHRWTKAGLIYELEKSGFKVISTNHILNEYSAALQHLIMCAEYRGTFQKTRSIVHLLTHVIILFLEKYGEHDSQVPSIICIQGLKQ